jgi:hypothetical protein
VSLLERFQDGSELDSYGEFTLDESKARQKMARFQLVSHEEFLMLAVQAVVAAKCSALEIALDGTLVQLTAREAMLDEEAVEGIEAFLFDSQPENVAYHLLAVAANAIEPVCQGPPRLAMQDDALVFEVRLTHPLPALAQTVRHRLLHLPCPLLLDGQPLPTEPLKAPRLELQDSGPSEIVLIRYGVQVSVRQLCLPIEFQAVCPADHLQLDASFSHVVENEAYQRIMRQLGALANEKLAERARAYQPEGENRAYLLAHLNARHPEPAGPALRCCPFFPLADRAGYASLQELSQQLHNSGRVLISQRNYNLQLPSPVVRLDDPVLRRTLERELPGGALEDAHQEFLQQQVALQNRSRWEASPRPTELPPGDYLSRAQVQGNHWQAEIGYLAPPGGASRVDVLFRGKLLANEPLDGVPPGATAVLNVEEAEVDRSWSRLEGRQYRSVLKELKEKLVDLFSGLELRDPGLLYPALSDYLLQQLSQRNPGRAARTAPLFRPAEEGPCWSLEQLAKFPAVHFGDCVVPLPNFPQPVPLPTPLLLYTPRHYQALVTQRGKEAVRDERALQRRLQTLDRQMARPRPPVLVAEEALLCRKEVRLGQAHGQLALTARPGHRLSCTLLYHGAELEKQSWPGGKVLEAVAVLEAPQLTPAPGWTQPEHDEQHRSLLKALREEVVALEQELLAKRAPLKPEIHLKLLRAYRPPPETYWDTPLIATTGYNALVSLRKLEQEIARHGHLLQGGRGVLVPGRLALLNPNKELTSFLQEALGSISWEQASVALRQHEQAMQFERRTVFAQIQVEGVFQIRVPLRQGRGEVVVLPPPRKSGAVDCFVRGRFVCRKSRLLPPPFSAAVESEAFTLSSDYQDVTVPEEVVSMLREHCADAMLQAAASSDIDLVERAWDYFRQTDDHLCLQRAQFLNQATLPRLDGSPVSLARLLESKIEGYVKPDFQTSLVREGLVLRLHTRQAKVLARFLSRRLNNLEGDLQDEQAYRDALSVLPTSLDPERFCKTFEDDGLKAVMAVGAPRLTVGLDSQGHPVGYLGELTMPVQVIVWGASPVAKKRWEPSAELPARAYQRLNDWAEALCLEWVQEKADDPQLVLELLRLSQREIGSRDDRPLAKMAGLLWDLPLFTRVDKTRVSGSALAATFSESREPIPVSSSTFRVPGSVIHLEENSEQHRLLLSVLGRHGISWYQAPPLIDPAEVGRSIKRLVSWGFAPFRQTASALQRLLETRPQEEVEPLARAPKTKPRKPKNALPSPKPSPESPKKRDPRDLLVAALKEDVRSLLGRELFKRSDKLFQALDFGSWPLGPPIYRPRGQSHFRLNEMHSGIRWLLSEAGDERSKRTARMMLVVHWVGLVNVASEELRDWQEDAFLVRLAERMTRTFS